MAGGDQQNAPRGVASLLLLSDASSPLTFSPTGSVYLSFFFPATSSFSSGREDATYHHGFAPTPPPRAFIRGFFSRAAEAAALDLDAVTAACLPACLYKRAMLAMLRRR